MYILRLLLSYLSYLDFFLLLSVFFLLFAPYNEIQPVETKQSWIFKHRLCSAIREYEAQIFQGCLFHLIHSIWGWSDDGVRSDVSSRPSVDSYQMKYTYSLRCVGKNQGSSLVHIRIGTMDFQKVSHATRPSGPGTLGEDGQPAGPYVVNDGGAPPADSHFLVEKRTPGQSKMLV